MGLIIFIVIAMILAFGIYNYFAEKKRREALAAEAARLGLNYRPDKDRGIYSQYGFLNRLNQGSGRYGQHSIMGSFQGFPVHVFEFHYETHSTDSKGHRRTHHHYSTIFTLELPRSFAELTIGPEGFFDKIWQAVGFDDIDFESHEFSRKFKVKSKDKKFAYDFCNARMIEYLLSHPDLVIELDGNILSFGYRGKIQPEAVEPGLRRLIALRGLMPEYLFT